MSDKELAELEAAVREAEKHELVAGRKSRLEKLVVQAQRQIRRKIEAEEHEDELLVQRIGHLRESKVERLLFENEMLQTTLDKALSLPQALPVVKPFGMRFVDAIEDYLSKINVGISTKNTYRPRLKKAMEFFGANVDVRYLDKAEILEYSAHVHKIIPSYNGRKLQISQVLTLVNWMRDTYHWGADISSRNLLPKKEIPDSEDRDAFTLAQMKVIFDNAKPYRAKCPEKYWATLSIAFLGCRVTEFAQINLDQDLMQHEAGFWYIRIAVTSDAEASDENQADVGKIKSQSVKNLASWRTLPIHPVLERHGFVEFLLAQRAKGHNRRPFQSEWGCEVLTDKHGGDVEEEADVRHHWGRPAIAWGSRELAKLRKNGIVYAPERKLGYFHSMRHTFEGVMIDEKIPFDIREAAVGHSYGGPDAERYAKLKKNPKVLLEQAFLPGLVLLAELLDKLWEEDGPETAQEAPQLI